MRSVVGNDRQKGSSFTEVLHKTAVMCIIKMITEAWQHKNKNKKVTRTL